MLDYIEALRFRSLNATMRKTEQRLKSRHGTIREFYKRADARNLTWPVPDGTTEEYKIKVRNTGFIPDKYSHFCDRYRKWGQTKKATMRIKHKPGDAMQVAWAGTTIPITDCYTEEISNAYLFVAVLPCSCYTYDEVCSDIKSGNWLICHVHAHRYFGGSTLLIIPDNITIYVTSNIIILSTRL